MLSININKLQSEYPRYRQSWELLEQWLSSHEQANVLSAPTIIQFVKSSQRSLSYNDITDLVLALDTLADQGLLKRRFALEEPKSGQLLYPYYSDPADIPSRVRGTFDEWVEAKAVNIKPVFVGADCDD